MRRVQPFWSQVRNYTALASTFIYNLNIFGISAKNICAPGFNCHGCPWATFSCPVGVIGYGFGVRNIPALALGMVLAVGIFLGRLVCGYACPFGLLQELLFRIKTRKFSLPRPLRYLKYVIMLLTVFILTYIFGFGVEKAYIRITEPIVAEDKPSLDITQFAEKNRGYFIQAKPPVQTTEGGFPLPPAGLGESAEGGLRSVGFGAGSKQGDDLQDFSLGQMLGEGEGVEPDLQSSAASETSGLEQIGVGGGGFDLDDLLTENEQIQENIASNKSVFELLQESKEADYADAELAVEVTVQNLSQLVLDEFSITPVFINADTGEEIWRGEEQIFRQRLEPGANYTTDIFTVPYLLHKGDIVILSEQTAVSMNYATLFCTYCPVAAIEADIPSKLFGSGDLSEVVSATTSMNLLRLGITFLIIIASIFISRFFCRTCCPLGAMYGLVARFAVFKIVLQKDKCIDCGKCDTLCPAELDVRKEVGGSECLACGDCVQSCPTKALKRKVGL